jgi:hypothetical protein
VGQNWANSNAMQPDVPNTRKQGKALQPALIELLVMDDPGSPYERARIVCSSSVGHGRILPSCSVVQDAVQHTTASARCAPVLPYAHQAQRGTAPRRLRHGRGS